MGFEDVKVQRRSWSRSKLFYDVAAQTRCVEVRSDVSILPERPWTFAPLEESWAMDMFAATHNAVRAEMGDLYGMVVSMVKRKHALTHDDVENFFVWWPVFARFLMDALVMEFKLVILPWEEHVAMAGAVSAIRREALLDDVRRSLQAISARMKSFRREDPKDLLPLLIDFVDRVLPQINALFSCAEVETVKYMLNCGQKGGGYDFMAAVVHYANTKLEQPPHHFIVLYLRGFAPAEQKQRMRELHLNVKKKLFFNRKKWRAAFEVAEEQLRCTHFQAVREFWRAWRMAESFINVNPADIVLPHEKLAAQHKRRKSSLDRLSSSFSSGSGSLCRLPTT